MPADRISGFNEISPVSRNSGAHKKIFDLDSRKNVNELENLEFHTKNQVKLFFLH